MGATAGNSGCACRAARQADAAFIFSETEDGSDEEKRSRVSGYNKWGYIFLIPFMLAYVIFQLIPLVSTIYNSFFENYMSGLTQIGPTFVGLDNYVRLFEGGDIWIYAKNTMVLWIMCFIPQIILSLLLGAWFSDTRLKLRGSRFFKTVIYLPNLIMFLNKHLFSKNYGMAGALSIVLFIMTGILSLIVFKVTGNDKRKG